MLYLNACGLLLLWLLLFLWANLENILRILTYREIPRKLDDAKIFHFTVFNLYKERYHRDLQHLLTARNVQKEPYII